MADSEEITDIACEQILQSHVEEKITDMLERERHNLDIRPDYYPFLKENNPCLLAFPSKTWDSSSHDQYHMSFVPGPPPSLPPIVRPQDGQGNNPHSKKVYHILKIDKEKVCNVESLLRHEHSVKSPPVSEMRENFTRQPISNPAPRNARRDQPHRGIVPGTSLSDAVPERVLPVCSRDEVSKMTTFPFWQYSGKRKYLQQPYQNGGVIYKSDQTTPRSTERFWKSVTSMNGKAFSKKRAIDGPDSSLSPQFFDGYYRDVYLDDKHALDKNELRPFK